VLDGVLVLRGPRGKVARVGHLSRLSQSLGRRKRGVQAARKMCPYERKRGLTRHRGRLNSKAARGLNDTTQCMLRLGRTANAPGSSVGLECRSAWAGM